MIKNKKRKVAIKTIVALFIVSHANGSLEPASGGYEAKDDTASVSYTGPQPSQPEGSCCEGKGTWVSNGSTIYAWTGDVVGDTSGSSVQLNTATIGAKSISVNVRRNWKCSIGNDTTSTERNASGTYTIVNVELNEAESQEYTGTSIFPNICQNAGTAYQKAKYVATVEPEGTTASLHTTGPVTSDKVTGIQNGDIITISRNSEEIGNYSIRLVHSLASTAEDEMDGVVFEFKLESERQQSHSPQEQSGGGALTYDGPGFSLGFSHSPSAGSSAFANTSLNYEIMVVTDPEGVFSGTVRVDLKSEWSLAGSLGISESRDDDGSNTVGVSVSIPGTPITMNFSSDGIAPLVAASAQEAMNFEGQTSTVVHSTTVSSREITFGFISPNTKFREIDFENSGDRSDSEYRDMEVGVDMRKFTATIGSLVARSPTVSTNTTIHDLVVDGHLINFEEQNGIYEIR